MSDHADTDLASANQHRKRETRAAAFRSVAAWLEQHEDWRPVDVITLLRRAADAGQPLDQAEKAYRRQGT